MYSTGRKKRQQPINLADIVKENKAHPDYLKVMECGSRGELPTFYHLYIF